MTTGSGPAPHAGRPAPICPTTVRLAPVGRPGGPCGRTARAVEPIAARLAAGLPGLRTPADAHVDLELARLRQVVVLELEEVLDVVREGKGDPGEGGETAPCHGVVLVAEPERRRVHVARQEVHPQAAAHVGPPAGAGEPVAHRDPERGVLARDGDVGGVHRRAGPPVLDQGQQLEARHDAVAGEAGAQGQARERALVLLHHGGGHALHAGEAAGTGEDRGDDEQDGDEAETQQDAHEELLEDPSSGGNVPCSRELSCPHYSAASRPKPALRSAPSGSAAPPRWSPTRRAGRAPR